MNERGDIMFFKQKKYAKKPKSSEVENSKDILIKLVGNAEGFYIVKGVLEHFFNSDIKNPKEAKKYVKNLNETKCRELKSQVERHLKTAERVLIVVG